MPVKRLWRIGLEAANAARLAAKFELATYLRTSSPSGEKLTETSDATLSFWSDRRVCELEHSFLRVRVGRAVTGREQRFVFRGADLTRDDIDGQILLLAA